MLAPSGGNAITINAGNNHTVVLRGLMVEGAGIGANGIVFNSGERLQISNCLIQGIVGSDENHGNGILLKHVRARCEATIERLIAFLDQFEPDCDLEDGGEAGRPTTLCEMSAAYSEDSEPGST